MTSHSLDSSNHSQPRNFAVSSPQFLLRLKTNRYRNFGRRRSRTEMYSTSDIFQQIIALMLPFENH